MILEEIEIIHRTEEIYENKQKLLKASEATGKISHNGKTRKGCHEKETENKKELALFQVKTVCQN